MAAKKLARFLLWTLQARNSSCTSGTLGMSIYGALNTAVSGLSAQSHAFTDISNNISNSQTVGYKATDTDFSDYVLSSADAQGTNGTVRATTVSQNEAQGAITASTNSLALAISGRGFFSVAEESGDSTTTQKQFQSAGYYTRNGDFSEDNLGYLVNSSSEYLKGYQVNNSTGVLDSKDLTEINVSDVGFRPTETGTVTIAATLPTAAAADATSPTATATAAMTQSSDVYDSTGHTVSGGLTTSWASTGTDTWTLTATVGSTTETAAVVFNTDGTLASVTPSSISGGSTSTLGDAVDTTGSAATFTIPALLTDGTKQSVSINLGTIGSTSGTTMSTSTDSTSTAAQGAAATVSSDSVTSGTFQGITMTADGDIMATFENDQTQVSQLVGEVPLATFADANALEAHDGEAYTATANSGAATLNLAGENGAGDLETSSVENSTTDLDTDLTKLITAQQAYGANAKVVTTANEMLQTVLSMKQ